MWMKLEDTVNLMCSEDFKDRFRAEFAQLEIRYQKLGILLMQIENHLCEFEPKSPVQLLRIQHQIMYQYMQVLKKRADAEGIDLKVVDFFEKH